MKIPNFNFLSTLKGVMNKQFGIKEEKAKPLVVSPLNNKQQGAFDRDVYEQKGGLVPFSQNQPASPSPAQKLPDWQPFNQQPQTSGQFPSVEQYGIPNPSSEIANIIMKNFPQDQWINAARVAFGESGYNPSAVGETNDWGLFQINPYWQRENMAQFGLTTQDLLDAEKNAQFAAWLQGQQGWRPWYAAQKIGLW